VHTQEWCKLEKDSIGDIELLFLILQSVEKEEEKMSDCNSRLTSNMYSRSFLYLSFEDCFFFFF